MKGKEMKFEEALKCMREGKKVKSSTVIYPLFIADYTNGFGETYKAICWNDGEELFYYTVEHNDIFAEDWEVVDEQKSEKNLTEQWKHGELEDGWYYYKASDGRNDIATEYGLYCVEADNNVELEVLAPVPSYTELQSMNEAVNQAMAANIKLVEQNKQLKELLIECREYFDGRMHDSFIKRILTKIDEVFK